MEQRLNNALEENKRLRDLHEERRREIDNLQINLGQDDAVEEVIKEERKRRDMELGEISSRYKSQIADLHTQLKQLQNSLENKNEECMSLSQLLEQRKRETDKLYGMVKIMMRTIS